MLQGELKIADFGLARYISKAGQQQNTDGKEGRMTNRVITVWYRWDPCGMGELVCTAALHRPCV